MDMDNKLIFDKSEKSKVLQDVFYVENTLKMKCSMISGKGKLRDECRR